MRGFEENVLNGIFEFLPLIFKFSTLQFLSKDFSNFVWNPFFNPFVLLNFENASVSVGNSLLTSRSGCEESLFNPGCIWSQLREIRIICMNDDEASLLDLIVMKNVSSLEKIEFIRPDSHIVNHLVSVLQNSLCVKKITVTEVQVDTVHVLVDLLAIPTLTDLTLTEVFLIKDQSFLSISSPSSSASFDEQTMQTISHALETMELYILPFSELLNFLKFSFSIYTFPHLKRLQIRCVSSVTHADQLACVIQNTAGALRALEDVEIGIVTRKLLDSIESVCSGAALRRLSFASRLEVDVSSDLADFALRFPTVQDLTVRIKNTAQLTELALVVSNSKWRESIQNIKITWSGINSIHVSSLVNLRIALGNNVNAHACQRFFSLNRSSFPISTECFKSMKPFDVFFHELCKDRIVCECDDCACGDQDESHIFELAQEEWDLLELDQRNHFSQRF